jgi:NAD-dependent deacetylase
VVVVNPHASDLDDAADAVLRGTAASLLPLLLEE